MDEQNLLTDPTFPLNATKHILVWDTDACTSMKETCNKFILTFSQSNQVVNEARKDFASSNHLV